MYSFGDAVLPLQMTPKDFFSWGMALLLFNSILRVVGNANSKRPPLSSLCL
jgi:hypothetical protein